MVKVRRHRHLSTKPDLRIVLRQGKANQRPRMSAEDATESYLSDRIFGGSQSIHGDKIRVRLALIQPTPTRGILITFRQSVAMRTVKLPAIAHASIAAEHSVAVLPIAASDSLGSLH